MEQNCSTWNYHAIGVPIAWITYRRAKPWFFCGSSHQARRPAEMAVQISKVIWSVDPAVAVQTVRGLEGMLQTPSPIA